MSIYSTTVDVAQANSQKGSAIRFEGRSLDIKTSITILWSKGVRFSKNNDKSRRTHPLDVMRKEGKQVVPTAFRFVTLTKNTEPLGNKSWGRIDFLVKYCGFRLVDERR